VVLRAVCATCNGVSCNRVPEVTSDSEEEDEQIPEINEFLSLQMPDGDDDDDGDDQPEEQEGNSQEEFINSDEFSSSIPIDPDQSGPSIHIYKEIEKIKTINTTA
jgi:hypothetical protein